MYDVDVSDLAYPCIVWVCRRIGLSISIQDFFELETVPYDKSIAVPGTIIKMEDSEDYRSSAVKMEGNLIISDYINMACHYAVIEKDDIVSEVVWHEQYLPVIQYRHLSKIRRPLRMILPETYQKYK